MLESEISKRGGEGLKTERMRQADKFQIDRYTDRQRS